MTLLLQARILPPAHSNQLPHWFLRFSIRQHLLFHKEAFDYLIARCKQDRSSAFRAEPYFPPPLIFGELGRGRDLEARSAGLRDGTAAFLALLV